MKKLIPILISISTLALQSQAQNHSDLLIAKHISGLQITGKGSSVEWNKTNWHQLPLLVGKDERRTNFKMLYSDSGVYFLFHNEDKAITTKRKNDFDSLWTDDVVEVFLWPDTTHTLYFEYELSPTNLELPILIPNINGNFLGWRPWMYVGKRRIQHKTSYEYDPGNKQNLTGWTGEFFIPYAVLAPLSNVPAKKGSTWRSNLYRVDYDTKKPIEWAWQKVDGSFHQYQKFGTVKFD